MAGKVIPLLEMGENSISLTIQKLAYILDKIGDCQFAIMSINGAKRTGKSYMLTKIIQKLTNSKAHKFTWRTGSDRTTLGIDIWSEPFFLTKSDGSRIAILLIDTQGSFDDATTIQTNAIIFALSALLSSTLIFNVSKDIREDTLQFFQCFTGFARKAIASDDSNSEDPFQKLIFLIRDMEFPDFAYGYYDETSMPPGQTKNYLDKLKPKAGQPIEIQFTHREILESFQEIGAFLLPHPGKELPMKDSEANLDPEFSMYCEEFIQLLINPDNIEPKQIFGHLVTAKEFKKHVEVWSRLFRSNELPQMRTVYESSAEMQNMMAKSNALNYYTGEMRRKLKSSTDGLTDEEFLSTHIELSEGAQKIFKNTRKMGGNEYESRFGEELQNEIEPFHEIFQDENAKRRDLARVSKDFADRSEKLQNQLTINEQKLAKISADNVVEREKYDRIILDIKSEKEKLKEKSDREMAEMQKKVDQAIKDRNKKDKRRGIFGAIGEVLDSVFS